MVLAAFVAVHAKDVKVTSPDVRLHWLPAASMRVIRLWTTVWRYLMWTYRLFLISRWYATEDLPPLLNSSQI